MLEECSLRTSSLSQILKLQMLFQSFKKSNKFSMVYHNQAKMYVDELVASRFLYLLLVSNAVIFNDIKEDFSEVIIAMSIRYKITTFHEVISVLIKTRGASTNEEFNHPCTSYCYWRRYQHHPTDAFFKLHKEEGGPNLLLLLGMTHDWSTGLVDHILYKCPNTYKGPHSHSKEK